MAVIRVVAILRQVWRSDRHTCQGQLRLGWCAGESAISCRRRAPIVGVALPSGLEPPVQGEKPTEHRHDQDVKAVQDADDQQNAADPGRLVLQLSCSASIGQPLVRSKRTVNRM